MPSTTPRMRRDSAAPAFLPTFFLGALLVVGAVILIALTDSPIADAGAIALLIALAVLFMAEITRRLRDDDD